MSKADDKLIYCGFGVHYNPETNERFEKTASGSFTKVDDGVKGLLERNFINNGLEKMAAQLESKGKGGKFK